MCKGGGRMSRSGKEDRVCKWEGEAQGEVRLEEGNSRRGGILWERGVSDEVRGESGNGERCQGLQQYWERREGGGARARRGFILCTCIISRELC